MYAISYKNISIFGHNCLVQNFRVPRKGRCNSVLFLIADDIMALKQDVWVVAPAIVYSGQVMTVCSKLINNNKLLFLLSEVSLLLECVECPLLSTWWCPRPWRSSRWRCPPCSCWHRPRRSTTSRWGRAWSGGQCPAPPSSAWGRSTARPPGSRRGASAPSTSLSVSGICFYYILKTLKMEAFL